MAVIPHPPHSPDLVPCYFFLFPKLKGCRFDTTEEIQAESLRVLDTLREKDFQKALQKCRRWDRCLQAGADKPYGEYYNFYSVSPEYFGYIPGYSYVCVFLQHLRNVRNIFIYSTASPTRCTRIFLCILYYITLALRVSGAICTQHQEHKLQSTAVSTRDCYGVLEVG
jgi:hypothetical protein